MFAQDLLLFFFQIPKVPQRNNLDQVKAVTQIIFDVKILVFLVYATITGIFFGSLTQEFM